MMFETIHHASREGARGADGGPRFLFPLLLLLLAGFLIAKAIRRRKHSEWHNGPGTAMQTLHDRFARGDIDQAEYDHRKAVLDGADVVPPAPKVTTPAPPTPPPAPADAPEPPEATSTESPTE